MSLLVLLKIAMGAAGLLIGGDFLVRGAAQFARSMGVSALVVGLTIVAMGTSMPELVVSVYAAIQGVPDVTVGNAIGSNTFNILFTLGLIAMIQPVGAGGDFLKVQLPIMLVAMVAPLVFSVGGSLPRPLAGVLLFGSLLYVLFMIRVARGERSAVVAEFESAVPAENPPIGRDVAYMIGGFVLMVAGSHYFLEGAIEVARWAGVSELVIGLTLVAAGTSLPETFTSLVAAWRREDDIALGNIAGSNIFNMLAILGSAGLITPLDFSDIILSRDMPVMIGSGVLMGIAVWTGGKVSRLEGLILFIGYIAYIYWLAQSQTAGAVVG